MMLALALGHADVDKMLATLPSSQIAEWQAYMSLENEAAGNAGAALRTQNQVSTVLAKRGIRA